MHKPPVDLDLTSTDYSQSSTTGTCGNETRSEATAAEEAPQSLRATAVSVAILVNLLIFHGKKLKVFYKNAASTPEVDSLMGLLP